MNLERIVKLLPLGAVILIGLGVLKTSIYYNYFGVDIMSYLTTTEVLTLFLNDYKSVLTLGIIAYFHFGLSEKTLDLIEERIIHFDFENFLRKNKWVYFLVFLGLTILFSLLFYYDKVHLYDIWIYLAVFSASNLTSYIFINKDESKPFYSDNKMIDLLQITAFTCAIPLLSLREIREIENNKGKQMCIFVENKLIITDTNNRFLGKAGDNYFFYLPKDNITRIIKAEEVKRIEIKL